MSDAQELKALLGRIKAERMQGRNIRVGLTAGVLLSVGTFMVNLYISAKNFDSDALLRHLETRATTVVWPAYERQLTAVAKEAGPAISAALEAEAEAILPKVSERLSKEALIFQDRMAKNLKSSLSRHFENAIKSHQAEFQKRFPDFEDREEVYEELALRLQTASRNWAQHKLDTTFEQHILILQSINETVQSLMAEARGEDQGDRSMEDVLSLMAEILNARVAEEG